MTKQFRIFLITTSIVVELFAIVYYSLVLTAMFSVISVGAVLYERLGRPLGMPDLTSTQSGTFFLPELVMIVIVFAQIILIGIKSPSHPRWYVYPAVLVVLFMIWRLRYFSLAGSI